MAFRYLIYNTGTTYAGTIIGESATPVTPSLYTDFLIPEIQPLYLWMVNNTTTPTAVIPNDDANIVEYLKASTPPPTYDDDIVYGEVTGLTSVKIDKVTGATDNIAIFTADGNLADGGYTIPELTGLTTYTFVESGGTQITQVGNTITIYSTTPTGSTVNWGDINGNISDQDDLWNILIGITGETATKLDTSIFTGYTASTQPVIDSALTGVTNLGTGTTLGGTLLRDVTLKSISVLGGLQILGDADNLIISGQTGGVTNIEWGDITGTLSDQTDLWNELTGLTAQIDTKLDITTFSGYSGITDSRLTALENWSGQTQPIVDLAITGATDAGTGTTLIVSDTNREITLKTISAIGGVTLVGDANNLIISGETNVTPAWGDITGTLSDQTDLWNELTGLTADIATKLDIATFSGYTGTTATLINSKVTKVTGATQNDIVIFGVGGEVADSGVQIRTDVRPVSVATDTYVPTELAVRTAINSAIAATIKLQGDWNATTNTPDLTVTGITTGFAWRVSVSGTTNLGGITDWQVGDLAVKTDAGWIKIDNEDIAAIWGNIGGTLSDQTDLWGILTGTTAATATKLDTLIFNNYTGVTQPILDGAITGATNGLTKTGRNVGVGGSLDGNTVIDGLGQYDLFISNIDEFQINTSGSLTVFGVDNGGLTFVFSGGSVGFEDNGGLKYGNDYSGNYTERSLVDAGYVTGLTSDLQSQIDFVSAATTANTSAIQTNFELFTGFTAQTVSQINYLSGVTSGNTQDIIENFNLFTGYTASTKNKDKKIQLISTTVINANVIIPTGITWNIANPYATDIYLWSGGTGIFILSGGTYEVQYHVTLKNSTSNQTHSIGGYLTKTTGVTTTTITETATATMIVGPSTSGELSLPPVVLTLNVGDRLDLSVFRIGNSGSAFTVSGSVHMVINKLT